MRVPKKILFILIIALALIVQGSNFYFAAIPSSGDIPSQFKVYDELPVAEPKRFDSLRDVVQVDEKARKTAAVKEFADLVIDGNSNLIKGVYVEDEFAFPVVQQPSGQAAFVSTIDSVVTDFAMPRKYGVTGLIAHNYLAGADFFNLNIGEIVQVIYGDGEIEFYEITDIQRYQALQPNSPNSQFIDLETSLKITATQLFKRVYMGSHHLTLQTCIEEGLEDSWGRLFIIADPI